MINRALVVAVASILLFGCGSSALVPENTVGGPDVVSATQTPMSKETSSLTLDVGKKVKAGQLAIAYVLSYNGNKPKVTPPNGWQLIRDDSSQVTRQSLYWHAMQANDPSSATWTFDAPVDAQGTVVLIDNADMNSPIDMSSGNTGDSGTATPKSIVTTSDGNLVLLFYSTDFSRPDLAPKMPENTTTVMDLDKSPYEYWILAAYQQKAGATEDAPVGQGQLFNWAAAQVAIKRAAGGASAN